METTPPDRTSPLRPLGPYGEGYCRYCHFVEALDQDGRLEDHYRGAQLAAPKKCVGSHRKPPENTPKESRKAAFKVNAPMTTCPQCLNTVPVLVDGRIGPHTPYLRVLEQCKGAYQPATRPVRGRNHGGERG